MGALIFTEILEFKTLNIITLNFLPSNELFLRKSIIYRYNTMKARYSLIEEKINDLLTVLKEKNPLLLVYLQKNLNLVPNYT